MPAVSPAQPESHPGEQEGTDQESWARGETSMSWTGQYRFLFFKRYFLMWAIFKVFIEFVTIILLFYTLFFWLRGIWDLGSLTRDQTCTPCIGR